MKKYGLGNFTLRVFLIAATLTLNYLIFIKSAIAADLEIVCSQEDCSKSTAQPLFNFGDGLWYPGKTVSKIILLKNDYKTEQEVTVQSVQKKKRDDLEDILYLTFVNNRTHNVTWEGNLARFNTKQSVSLGKLKAGESLEVLANLRMPRTTSLNYQNQKTAFDLTFIFSGDKSNKRIEKKKQSRVLGQSTENAAEQPWISRLFSAIRTFFSRIAGIFKF